MTDLDKIGNVIETDVLVIGGGVAGLWAANKASEFVNSVTIVDKGPRDWGGLASGAGGDFVAVMPDESVEDVMKDVIYFYDGLCQQDIVEKILTQSYARLKDYLDMGVEFFKEPDGRLTAIPEFGLDNFKMYISKGGIQMVNVLVKKAKSLGIRRVNRTLVTELIKVNGKIAGAFGFNTLSGEFQIFKSKVVILTTGNVGWKHGFFSNTSTGEGQVMALKAGAELRNYEFVANIIIPKKFAWEGLARLMPLGGEFVNAKGESFMDKYSPFGTDTEDSFTCRAMAIEASKGNNPFFMDCTGIKPEDRKLVEPESGWSKLHYEKLKKLDLDLLNQKTEWVPSLDEMQGGIAADVDGNTSVPGLFVAGRAMAYQGGTYLCGWSLCSSAVTGNSVGELAGQYASAGSYSKLDASEIKNQKKLMLKPLGKQGIAPKEILYEIQETILPANVSMVKNESSLKKAISRIETIRNDLIPRMSAETPHYLMKSIEISSMAVLNELFLKASLMRRESRMSHYRADYPERDDSNGLKWIMAAWRNSELRLREKPLPMDKYKIKPTRYYSDNFNF